MISERIQSLVNRRAFLTDNLIRLGSVAFSALLAQDATLANPLRSRPSAARPKAKSIIFLFLTGGPSQIETFDPKPELNQLHGQPLPESFGEVSTQRTNEASLLLGCRRQFRRWGESGLEISDLFPNLATCADDLAIVRSCYADSVIHAPAMYQMNTGRIAMGHPCLGSWVTYGLGSESNNLPAFVVMTDPIGPLTGGPPCWGSGFLPPIYQGTLIQSGTHPIPNLQPTVARSRERQRSSLDLLQQLNRLDQAADQATMEARLASYELAYRMQSHAPEAVDLSHESIETLRMYGCDREPTREFGRRCLLARRLVERGVRFIQLYHGGGPGNMTWDGHGDIEENHLRMAGEADQPIAGLINDLKQRGLLDETLVVCGGEFGRTPMSQGQTGRDHNPFGFSVWLAGGGVKAGQVIGATDAVGLRAVEDRHHVNDLHATILQLLGIDHWDLTFRHEGRDERLTDAEGSPISALL